MHTHDDSLRAQMCLNKISSAQDDVYLQPVAVPYSEWVMSLH